MNLTILGDPHITEDSIPELRDIFQETVSYGNKEKETLIILGDYYDNKRPSPKELYFGTKSIDFLKKYFKQIVLLTGNHAELAKDLSNVDYLEFLNIIVCDEYEVTEKKENPGIFFGHFMTNESLLNYGYYDRDRTIGQLEKYQFVLLGHQHTFQEVRKTIYHLGSCRWVTYGEKEDKEKYLCKVEGDKFNFIPLKSPIPIKEVLSIEELKDIPIKTKVLLSYKNFEQYKNEIVAIQNWKSKFYAFKIKLDFQEMPAIDKQYDSDYETIFNSFLNNIKDNEVKKLLKEHFLEAKENYIR